MKKKETRFLNIELRAENKDSRTVSGYAIVFNSPSENLGGFIEVVSPKALNKTLKENKGIKALKDHSSMQLLGTVKADTLRVKADEVGLYFELDLPETSNGNDVFELIKRGDIGKCSFGFSTVNESWKKGSDGLMVRTLEEIKLYEISLLTGDDPAYSNTSVNLRSYLQAVGYDEKELTDIDPLEVMEEIKEEDRSYLIELEKRKLELLELGLF